jgi:hypothetical protein
MSLRLCANELNGFKSTDCIVLNVKWLIINNINERLSTSNYTLENSRK